MLSYLSSVGFSMASRPAAESRVAAPRMDATMPTEYRIAPSILSADFARLGEEVQNVLDAGADVVHFDVMDNHYVPNLTIGPMVCTALKKYGITAPIDVHLMVSPVDAIIGDFADAGLTSSPSTRRRLRTSTARSRSSA